ncbi:MAG: efflux RND transporter permease subunit [Proteobacteria bacterium]|nr:efflux RND transporter permease subunit [Pseudomonadota bacterium]
MGAAVIGGLAASTALSLFVVPVIYTLMDDFEHRAKRLFGRLKPRRAAAPEATAPNAAP